VGVGCFAERTGLTGVGGGFGETGSLSGFAAFSATIGLATVSWIRLRLASILAGWVFLWVSEDLGFLRGDTPSGQTIDGLPFATSSTTVIPFSRMTLRLCTDAGRD
jgi:hypothetical protein